MWRRLQQWWAKHQGRAPRLPRGHRVLLVNEIGVGDQLRAVWQDPWDHHMDGLRMFCYPMRIVARVQTTVEVTLGLDIRWDTDDWDP